MPADKLRTLQGRVSLFLGLTLAAPIVLWACLCLDSWALGPAAASGGQYTEARRYDARNTQGAHAAIPDSSLSTANTCSPVSRLFRRNEKDDVLEPDLWKSQKIDGVEGTKSEKTKEEYDVALARANKAVTERAGLTSLAEIKQYGWERGPPYLYVPFAPGLLVALEGLNIPSDDDVWSRITFRHSLDTTRGEQNYPATDAYYAFAFSLKYRTIVVFDSKGPEYTETGKALKPEQRLPTKHLSDMLFLEWESICKQAEIKPASLRYIIRNGVTNAQTCNVVRELVGGSLSAELIEWPGIKYTENIPKQKDAVKALLGTPNGVAIGHMLAQHRQALGTLQVTAAVVWKVKPESRAKFVESGPRLWMLFELNEVAPKSTQELRRRGGPSSGRNPGGPLQVDAAQTSRSHDEEDRSIGNSPSDESLGYVSDSGSYISESADPNWKSYDGRDRNGPVDEPTWKAQKIDGGEGGRPAIIEDAWNGAVKRGQIIENLWSLNSIPSSERAKFWEYGQIEDYGWTRETWPSSANTFSTGIRTALEGLNVPLQGDWIRVKFTHSKESVVNGKTYPMTGGFYEMTLSPKYGILVVENAHGPAHTNAGQSYSQIGNLVPLAHLSDIMFLEWQELCKHAGIDLTSMKYVMHNIVRNPDSRDVAREAVGGSLSANLDVWPGNSFTTASPLFKGILGAPNSVAVWRLLTQRAEVMGGDRRIVKALLWKAKPSMKKDFVNRGPDLYMLFELSDTLVGGAGVQEGSSKRPGSPILDAGPAKRPAGPQV